MMDVEADGPIPGDYSMISFGAVVVEPSLKKKYSACLRPISNNWLPKALNICHFTREETLSFPDPAKVMLDYARWIQSVSSGVPHFISDNNGFDWQFINWYFIHFMKENPFGYTSTNLGSLYKGIVKNTFAGFKHLRKTEHTHKAIDDALGNAEALLELKNVFGLNINLE